MFRKEGNLIISNTGLLSDKVWKNRLREYPVDLLIQTRYSLKDKHPDIVEKYNIQSKYFGYSKENTHDLLYIYVRKKYLRFDLEIDQSHEEALRRMGFKVKFINNFQGRENWITGWYVPHDTKKIKQIVKYFLKAFDI